MTRFKPIVDWDLDEATYVGDGEDGCYFLAQEHKKKWYVTVVVDCNTAHFCDDLETDAGPFNTRAQAEAYGNNMATDWCINNQVNYTEEEDDAGR